MQHHPEISAMLGALHQAELREELVRERFGRQARRALRCGAAGGAARRQWVAWLRAALRGWPRRPPLTLPLEDAGHDPAATRRTGGALPHGSPRGG
jgi:hypothetical protein